MLQIAIIEDEADLAQQTKVKIKLEPNPAPANLKFFL